MTPDTQLAIYLRKRELSELRKEEAQLVHIQERIQTLEDEIKQLEENGK